MWSGSKALVNSYSATSCMSLRPFVVFDCVATGHGASQSGSFKWQWRDWDRVHSNFWSVHCPSAVYHSPRYTTYCLDVFCVPSALRFQSSDFASSEYTICIPHEALCAGVSHPKPNSVLISWVHSVPRLCGDLSCQHLFSKTGQTLVSASCRASSQMASFRHDLSGTWTGCIQRAPPTMVRQVTHH